MLIYATLVTAKNKFSRDKETNKQNLFVGNFVKLKGSTFLNFEILI